LNVDFTLPLPFSRFVVTLKQNLSLVCGSSVILAPSFCFFREHKIR
jgi:hypothetical protein